MTEQTRQCTKCKIIKPLLTGFYKSVTGKDGRTTWCKDCKKLVTRTSQRRWRDTSMVGSEARGETQFFEF